MTNEELPMGWGATELAEHNLRLALEKWGDPNSQASRYDRGMSLAASARTLLRELDKDRAIRRDG